MLEKGIGLYTDYYELTMAQGYFFQGKKEEKASFDYFFRSNPFQGGYTVFAGLGELLSLLEKLEFEPEAREFLRQQGFKEEFLQYLADFEFEGDIYSCQEGEIVFPGEPVLRVEGNIIEAQLVETLVLNILNFASLIATKASRMSQVAKERKVVDFGLRRAQALGGILASRAAVMGGAVATSNTYSGARYDLPVTGTQAHAWIQSFDSELTAFRKFAELYPQNCVLLVDTYDTLQSGLPNAIKVAHEMEKRGEKLLGIRLDSGDLDQLSRKSRQMLDKAGLEYVQIAASGQLDEYKIQKLVQSGAPIDLFGVGTRLITGKDDAALNGVYKLARVGDRPSLKVSEDKAKIILPGKKNVYRCLDGDEFLADAIILETEKPEEVKELYHLHQAENWSLDCTKREALLKPVMERGNSLLKDRTAEQISTYRQQRLEKLPVSCKDISQSTDYRVGISPDLYQLREKLITEKSD